jgi:hypothetical protein
MRLHLLGGKPSAAFLALPLLLAGWSIAQKTPRHETAPSSRGTAGGAPAPREMKEGRAIGFPLPAPMGTMASSTCDSEGNPYLIYGPRPPQVGPGPIRLPNLGGLPVTRLSLLSQETTQYDAHPLGDGYVPLTFAVDPSGKVYRMFAPSGNFSQDQPERPVIVRYDSHGSVDTHFELEIPDGTSFTPTNLAAFGDSALLVTGILKPVADRPNGPSDRSQTAPPGGGVAARPLPRPRGDRPFTAIFDSGGAFVTELALPHEIGADASALGGPWIREAFHSAMVPGPRDTVYLLRPTDPPTLYTISAYGQTIHEARIAAFKGYDTHVMRSAGDSDVMIGFSREVADKKYGVREMDTYAIIDPATGDVVAAYDRPKRGGLLPLCATGPREFEFIGTGEDGNLAVFQYTGE